MSKQGDTKMKMSSRPNMLIGQNRFCARTAERFWKLAGDNVPGNAKNKNRRGATGKPRNAAIQPNCPLFSFKNPSIQTNSNQFMVGGGLPETSSKNLAKPPLPSLNQPITRNNENGTAMAFQIFYSYKRTQRSQNGFLFFALFAFFAVKVLVL